MPPSVALIRFNALVTALRTTVKHYTSRNYPLEWDLRFHIQFAILRNLLEGTGHWTIEDVLEGKIVADCSIKFWRVRRFLRQRVCR
jgi:hypothetical protein